MRRWQVSHAVAANNCTLSEQGEYKMTPSSRFDDLLGMLELDDAHLRTSAVRELIGDWPARAGPLLLRAFRSETDEVRIAILEAFAEAGRPEAVDLILLLYQSGLPQDLSVARAALLRMGSLAFRGLRSVVRGLERPSGLERPEIIVCMSAIRCFGELGRNGHTQAPRYLARVVNSGIENSHPDLFCLAADELASMHSRAGARRMCALLKERHPAPEVRLACVRALMSTDRLRIAVDPLVETCLHDPDSEVRAAAMGVLQWLGQWSLPSAFWETLYSEAEYRADVRAAVLRAMPGHFRPDHAGILDRAFDDRAPQVRQAAAELFGNLYDWRAPHKDEAEWRKAYLRLLPAIERLASDVWEDTGVREAAAAALVATASTHERYSKAGSAGPHRAVASADAADSLTAERLTGPVEAGIPEGATMGLTMGLVAKIITSSDEAPQVRRAAVRAFAQQDPTGKDMSGLLPIIQSSIDPGLVAAALEALQSDWNFASKNEIAMIQSADRLFAMAEPQVHLAAMDLFSRIWAAGAIPILVDYAADPKRPHEDRIQAGITIGRIIAGIPDPGKARHNTWTKLAKQLRESSDPVSRVAGIPFSYNLWYGRYLVLAKRYQKDNAPLVRRYGITFLEEWARDNMRLRMQLLVEVREQEDTTIVGSYPVGKDSLDSALLWNLSMSSRGLARFTEELSALQDILVHALSDKDLGVRFAAVTLLGWAGLSDAKEIVESFREQNRRLLHEGKSLSGAASLALKRLKQRATRQTVYLH